MKTIDIGIDSKDRLAITEGLKVLMADTYSLYLQTHNFHWNVTGPHFRELHLMFEEQYTELALAVDAIAERIRSLGFPAPGTYSEFAKLGSLEEVAGVPGWTEMVDILTANNEHIVRLCRETLKLASSGGDESTLSLVSDRMVVHEKTAWMLRSVND